MISREKIDRALSLLPQGMRELVRNNDLRIRWIGGTNRFWYRRELADGHDYLLGDADAGTVEAAFDHRKMADLLAEKAGIACCETNLPIDFIEYEGGDLKVTIGVATWAIDRGTTASMRICEGTPQPGEILSADNRRAVFLRDNNLWARDTQTDRMWNLTGDGVEGLAYAKSPDGNLCTVSHKMRCVSLPAAAAWSPDSRYVVTHVLDERNVRPIHLVHRPSDMGGRQALHTIRMAFPGDVDIPTLRHLVIDIETGAKVWAALPPQIANQGSSIERGHVWWSADGKSLYIIGLARAEKSARLFAVNAATGNARTVVEEYSDTFIELRQGPVVARPNVRVVDETGEVIWFSQRDGWGHLYLYDLASGELKNQITRGPWLVRSIHHVDPSGRQIYFLASGHDAGVDPYYRKLYRIGFDGEGLECLTPEDIDHDIAEAGPIPPRAYLPGKANLRSDGVSSTGKYFVVAGSTLDRPIATSIRRADGAEIMMLEPADVQAAQAKGWLPPQPFKVKAADGTTDLYGAMWLPPDFDANKLYPVLDYIFAGPQIIQTPKRCFSPDEFNRSCIASAFSELGFVVVTVDGRGTPYRSKNFHDFIYGTLQSRGGLEDHVSALKQLAHAHSYMDLGRTGAFGHSAGAAASLMGLLMHSDTYKAAAGSAGGYDLRGFVFYWGEKYIGPLTHDANGRSNFDDQFVGRLAGDLSGHLLLGYGDLDDGVSPALATQLIQSLNAHNKDFEVVLVPNANHSDMEYDPHWIRSCMRFFARTLLPNPIAQKAQISSIARAEAS